MPAPISQESVRQALRRVLDPELGVNIVDLGLVRKIECGPGRVAVSVGMTSPACPVGPHLRDRARRELLGLEGVETAEVELLADFAWSPAEMSEEARKQLGWNR